MSQPHVYNRDYDPRFLLLLPKPRSTLSGTSGTLVGSRCSMPDAEASGHIIRDGLSLLQNHGIK